MLYHTHDKLVGVSRDRPDTSLRDALIDAAARLLVSEGPAALTLRRVANDVGTSTMAVYTHFGGMAELRRAVGREGFARLADQLAAVEQTDDAVADLAVLGLAYRANATNNPDLYRIMCMERPLDPEEAKVAWEAFGALVAGVQRCIATQRFAPGDATDLAIQLWALSHGVVTLELAQLLTTEQALSCLGAAVLNLLTSYGDERETTLKSLGSALARANPQVADATPAPS